MSCAKPVLRSLEDVSFDFGQPTSKGFDGSDALVTLQPVSCSSQLSHTLQGTSNCRATQHPFQTRMLWPLLQRACGSETQPRSVSSLSWTKILALGFYAQLRSDFCTRRFWHMSPVLKYDFGLLDGSEFDDTVQHVILSLVKALRFKPEGWFQQPKSYPAEMLESLQKLEAHELVEKRQREAWADWRLTEVAQRRLQSSQIISAPRLALTRADEEVELDSRNVFQLLCDLEADKWTLPVYDPALHRSSKKKGQ